MRETSSEIFNIMVHFLNQGGESRSVHVDSSAMTLMTPNRNLTVSQLTIPMPSFIATGDFNITHMTVKFEMVNGQNKTAAPIPVTFFDGLLPRVVEIKPTSVPTSALISGRKLELKSTVAVTFANLPQENMGIAEIAARLKLSAKPVSVVSVKHMVTCLSSGSNCNRTQIVFELPGMDSPGNEKLGITWTNGELEVELEFQPPCDVGYDRFCQDKSLIANFQLLEAKPTIACSTDYCIDPATIRNPAVLDFSPKEGPVSGGTLLTVWLKDLPAFSASDVSVQVVGSTSSSSTQVVSLSQSPTSTLKNGKASITFETPLFKSLDEFATIEIAVMIGGSKRLASFRFEYMPDITGDAIVEEFFPQTIYAEQDLKLLVTLTNVARLSFPYVSEEIKATVAGHIDASDIEIVTSSRYFTSVRISFLYTDDWPTSGALEIKVGSDDAKQGKLNVTLQTIPGPGFVSGIEYPLQSVRLPPDTKNVISVKIAYLNTNLISNDEFSATMSFLSEGGGDPSDYNEVILDAKYPLRLMGEDYAQVLLPC